MAEEESKSRKRVWILGAGFSRSLGGPLMNDLLSVAAWRQVLALYKDPIARDDADLIFWLFHYGWRFQEGSLDPEISGPGERRWQDAEQFLEVLERASAGDRYAVAAVDETYDGLRIRTQSSPGLAAARYPGAFGRAQKPSHVDLAKMAKRMVAAACCGFIEGVTTDNAQTKERWRPYLDWMACLKADDSILTFNYDLVVETLKADLGQHSMAAHVAGPGDSAQERENDSLARARRVPVLYKLHGSVNWNIEGDGRVTKGDSLRGLLESSFNIAIATPGDSKVKMADNLFRRLWGRAGEKIREAAEVYIIGFRFPQGDAYPRAELLDALSENKNNIDVHVVLGPDRNSDQARVLAILQAALGTEQVRYDSISRTDRDNGAALHVRSMWAEDFLDSWARANRGYELISPSRSLEGDGVHRDT